MKHKRKKKKSETVLGGACRAEGPDLLVGSVPMIPSQGKENAYPVCEKMQIGNIPALSTGPESICGEG